MAVRSAADTCALQHPAPTDVLSLDVHTGNVAFELSGVDVLPETELSELLQPLETGTVMNLMGERPQSSEAPTHAYGPYLFKDDAYFIENSIRLIDFGESFREATRPKKLNNPMVIRAPELLLHESFDHRVDLWAAGCMVSVPLPCIQASADK